jgi:hypothetical protein
MIPIDSGAVVVAQGAAGRLECQASATAQIGPVG